MAGWLILIFVAACGSPAAATPTTAAMAVDTQAAASAQAQLSAAFALTPSATATLISTNTLIPLNTVVTQSALQSMPVTLPSSTVSANPDQGAWISNDPPDGTVLAPEQTFTLTWVVENSGTSTWNTDYLVQFISGTNMGANNFNLKDVVYPNNVVDIRVKMITPKIDGTYTTDWVITSDEGVNFRPLSFEFTVSGTAPTDTITPTPDTTPTPSITPSYTPTKKPSATPTLKPTKKPTKTPTLKPTKS